MPCPLPCLGYSASLDLGVAVLDFGRINWNNGFEVNASGNASFDGINVSPFFQGDSVDLEFFVDSLLGRFSVNQSIQSFQTRLPTRYVVHAGFEPVEWFRLQGMLQTRQLQGGSNTSWALGGQLQLGRVLDLGLSYGRRSGIGGQVGVQSSVKLGPVMMYAMSDHILSLFQWEQARIGHLRVGMNIQIGRQNRKDPTPAAVDEIPLE